MDQSQTGWAVLPVRIGAYMNSAGLLLQSGNIVPERFSIGSQLTVGRAGEYLHRGHNAECECMPIGSVLFRAVRMQQCHCHNSIKWQLAPSTERQVHCSNKQTVGLINTDSQITAGVLAITADAGKSKYFMLAKYCSKNVLLLLCE